MTDSSNYAKMFADVKRRTPCPERSLMNICIMSPEFPPLTNWGGVATFNYNLALLLTKLGHRVFVLTIDPRQKRKYRFVIPRKNKNGLYLLYLNYHFENKIADFFYFCFPIRKLRKILSNYFPLSFSVLEWNFFAMLGFKKLKKLVNIDIVHTPEYSCPALFFKLCRFNPPLIVHSQGPQDIVNRFLPHSFDRQLKSLLEIAYVEFFPQIVVACSDSIRNFWQAKGIRTPIVTIPNFINPNTYRKISFTAKSKQKGEEINLFFIGRLENRKGTDILLKAFLEIVREKDNLKLIVIGNDTQTFELNDKRVFFSELREKIEDRQTREKVEIVGWKTPNDLLNLISRRKGNGILILPSRYEPFGFVVLEGMAMGLLTIASTEGGAREIISHNYDGFLVKPEVPELVRVLRKIVSRPSHYEVYRSRARQKVFERYSLKKIAKSYQLLYSNITF